MIFVSVMVSIQAREPRQWESIEQIIQRVHPVLDRYVSQDYEQIAVVAHGGVIRRFLDEFNVEYCVPYMISYTPSVTCFGWVD